MTPEPEADEAPIEAILRAYSPVYDINAPRWRFWLGEEHHYMDVSESNVREVVLENGGALIDDRFRVKLQRITKENEKGETSEDYKVLEVLEFIPAFRQAELFSGVNYADDTQGSSQDGQD